MVFEFKFLLLASGSLCAGSRAELSLGYIHNLKRYFSSLSNNSRPNNAYPIAEYQSCGDKNQNYPVENGLNTSSDSSENNNYMDKHSSSSTLTSDDSEDETSSDSTENNNM